MLSGLNASYSYRKFNSSINVVKKLTVKYSVLGVVLAWGISMCFLS